MFANADQKLRNDSFFLLIYNIVAYLYSSFKYGFSKNYTIGLVITMVLLFLIIHFLDYNVKIAGVIGIIFSILL